MRIMKEINKKEINKKLKDLYERMKQINKEIDEFLKYARSNDN